MPDPLQHSLGDEASSNGGSDYEPEYQPEESPRSHGGSPTPLSSTAIESFLSSYSEEKDGLAFVVEEMYESFFIQPRASMGLSPNNPDAFEPARDPHVKCYHVVAPRSDSFHIFRDLCCPHYTLTQSEIRHRFCEQSPQTPGVLYPSHQSGPFPGSSLGFVNVWRNTSLDPLFIASQTRQPTGPSLHDPSFQALLVEQVLRFGTGDGRRGNRYIDIGYCGDECTTRQNDPHGLAHPNTRSLPVGCDANSIMTAFVLLSQMMSEFISPDVTPERYAVHINVCLVVFFVFWI